MNKARKRFQVVLTAAGMAVCMTAGLGLGIYWSRGEVEKTAVAAAERGLESEVEEAVEEDQRYQLNTDEDVLYKDKVLDTEIAKEVCDKYNLDYNKVRNSDITREMRNYEEALWLSKDMGNRPLFGYAVGKGGFSSLQAYIDKTLVCCLLDNLTANAARVGNKVRIMVNEEGIRIWNNGEPMDEKLLRDLNKGQELPVSRMGKHGYGIQICREIAKAHGWKLRFRSSREGRKYFVRLVQPLEIFEMD